MVVTSPECVDPYSISDSCGVSASSALSEETLPGNVILDDDTFWAPAIRLGTSTSTKTTSKYCHNEGLVLDGTTI